MNDPTLVNLVAEPGAVSTLAELVEQRARLAPAAPAILAPGAAALDYARLQWRVSRIAEDLRGSGLSVGDRVGVVLPNGPGMAVAVLGVAACCTCAPLITSLTRSEFSAAFRDLALSAVLLAPDAQAAREAAAEAGIAVFVPRADVAAGGLVRESEASTGPRTARRGQPRSPAGSDTALLLRTSGTTSKPKRVPLTHANLLGSARSIAATLALTPADRALNVMPLFHIHGLVGVLLSSLCAGASVACTPGLGAESFFAWLREFAPTWYSAVPTMHQAVLRAGAGNAEAARAARLRFVRSSSASLPPRVMVDLEALFDAPVIEAYGMTEASHQMASNPLPPAARKPGSVGLPAGTRIRVVAADGTDVPGGERGEIVICGAGVVAGYEAEPAVNAAAFVDGWLRTGDQGRFDEDGYLYVTGRLKELINRGGEKVSPKEIDEVLLEHPQVLEAAAFGVPHPSLGEDVAAAVVVRDRAAVDAPALRAHLLKRLAVFKVPSRLLLVDAIPKGSTGKIERVSLAQRLLPAAGEEYVAPEGATAIALAAIFAEVLEVERVGANDNFWALGGDSLRATRVLARVRATMGVELPILTLFEFPTVAEAAREVDRALAAGAATEAADTIRPIAR